eukprot:Gb_12008 [translate_table: standard]
MRRRMGKVGMISALFMFGVISGLCKQQIYEDPALSICPQKHPQSGPTCPLGTTAELNTKTVQLTSECRYEDSDVSGFHNSGQENWGNGSIKVVCVEEFGAKGDGDTDDTKAFKKAWKKACSSAPSVFLVPKGRKYLVKPIKFSGPCLSSLTVQVSGTIIAPEDPHVWDGLKSTQWLRFHAVDDLTVEGGGTIYGSGEKWWAQSCKINKTKPCRSGPTALRFESSNNLRVRNLMVKNGQQMHMTFRLCIGVEADHLEVTAPGHSPNTDGIHISASKYVAIKNSIIGTGDDCISIVSDSFHVRIENITCGPGHGISIGSLGKGHSEAQVSDVIVDGASLHNTTNGLRIKSWQGGSGFARGIRFQNVHMDNVSHPIIIDQYYCDSKKPCPNQTSAVRVSEVAYMNIKGTSATKEVMRFVCSKVVACQNVVLIDIDLTLISRHAPTTFCENALGFSMGSVNPPPCLENYRCHDDRQIKAQRVLPQPKDEL